MLNLSLPGHPRYQPKSLQPIFGYDLLYQAPIEVEIAGIEVLGELGIIPREDFALFTPEVKKSLFEITTTMVDELERVINHDVRALVRLIQERLPVPLRRWVHVPYTSYDPLSTGQAVQFKRAHAAVVRPKVREVIRLLIERVRSCADAPQIGRTHGQWAVPITIGFWLATILNRIIVNARKMDALARELEGKISGPTGPYNAQHHLGILARCADMSFERRVLDRLGVRPAAISTQIVPPESLAYYLHACVMLAGAFGQFGRDCRSLAKSEIREIVAEKEDGHVGSSSMPQKTNPIWAEQLEGMSFSAKDEYAKVLDTLISDHQRDLVGSSIMRSFPVIIVDLVVQLEGLLRKDKKTQRSLLERIAFDRARCLEHIKLAGPAVLAEPAYLMLQISGYQGDAHKLLNDKVIPMLPNYGGSFAMALQALTATGEYPGLDTAIAAIPDEQLELLEHPERYVGLSEEKALEICEMAEEYLRQA